MYYYDSADLANKCHVCWRDSYADICNSCLETLPRLEEEEGEEEETEETETE